MQCLIGLLEARLAAPLVTWRQHGAQGRPAGEQQDPADQRDAALCTALRSVGSNCRPSRTAQRPCCRGCQAAPDALQVVSAV